MCIYLRTVAVAESLQGRTLHGPPQLPPLRGLKTTHRFKNRYTHSRIDGRIFTRSASNYSTFCAFIFEALRSLHGPPQLSTLRGPPWIPFPPKWARPVPGPHIMSVLSDLCESQNRFLRNRESIDIQTRSHFEVCRLRHIQYRDTSLTRNSAPLRPYGRPMPGDLWWS